MKPGWKLTGMAIAISSLALRPASDPVPHQALVSSTYYEI